MWATPHTAELKDLVLSRHGRRPALRLGLLGAANDRTDREGQRQTADHDERHDPGPAHRCSPRNISPAAGMATASRTVMPRSAASRPYQDQAAPKATPASSRPAA